MDDTVGDLLNLRGVRLVEATGITETIGFRCLGIAERIPDLEDESSASVHVWHVRSTLLPLSVAEAERWLVDAPSGPHWMLSEREFEPAASELLNSRLKIELWGPETLSRWIGEAVLRGDLQAIIPTNPPISEVEQELPDSSHSIDRVVLSPIVDLDEWLMQRGLEFVEANPVLIEARIWRVDGTLVSPKGVQENGSWRVLEDPWAGRLELHEADEVLSNAPKLRLVDANPEIWFGEDDLRVMLVGILETRRQKQEEAEVGSAVRSTMLERWTFDSSEAELEMIPTAIPAWIIDHDRGRELLHSRNGRTYEINSVVEP
jgi:hypothetical protein